MDQLKLLANTEERGATKREGVKVPDESSNSSDEAHDGIVQPGTEEAAIDVAAPQVPMVESRGTQDPAVQTADGEESHPTELV